MARTVSFVMHIPFSAAPVFSPRPCKKIQVKNMRGPTSMNDQYRDGSLSIIEEFLRNVYMTDEDVRVAAQYSMNELHTVKACSNGSASNHWCSRSLARGW